LIDYNRYVLDLLLLLLEPAHVREICGGSSSRLSRHLSRSATTSNFSLGWRPNRLFFN